MCFTFLPRSCSLIASSSPRNAVVGCVGGCGRRRSCVAWGRQARKKELETKAALWDDRGSKLQRELAALREENLRLTHSMQARPKRYPRCPLVCVMGSGPSTLQLELAVLHESQVGARAGAGYANLITGHAAIMHSCILGSLRNACGVYATGGRLLQIGLL